MSKLPAAKKAVKRIPRAKPKTPKKAEPSGRDKHGRRYMFRLQHARLVPVLDVGEEGGPLVEDGRHVFTLDQAAEFTKERPKDLIALHGETWPAYVDKLTCEEGDYLLDLLRVHVPPTDPTRVALEVLLENTDGSYEQVDDAAVRKAIDRFYETAPAGLQMKIFNGWKPRPQRPRAMSLRPQDVDVNCRLGVLIHPKITGRGEGDCYADWIVGDTMMPVEVRVFSPASKADALKWLDNARAYIDQNWDDIVKRDPP